MNLHRTDGWQVRHGICPVATMGARMRAPVSQARPWLAGAAWYMSWGDHGRATHYPKREHKVPLA